MKITYWLGCVVLLLTLFSCKKEVNPERIKIERFDTELYQVLTKPEDKTAEKEFLSKYRDFLPLYLSGILHAPQAGKLPTMDALRSFFTDSTLMQLYAEEQLKYNNVSAIEGELGDAVTHYKTIFPNRSLPKFRMHLSGLTQSVVTVGSCVSIAGDKFIGKDYPLYKGYFYDYQLRDMSGQYIVRDALRAYLYGEFPLGNQQNLLDQIIYQGKMKYLLSLLLPNKKAEETFGYSAKQWDWLLKAEKDIWLYMAENQHLYSTDPVLEAKYTGEAPFTPLFGESSPPRAGVWIGYRIVESYVKNKSISVLELMNQKDARKILEDSGYQP